MSFAKKPERQIPTRHRFSIKKTFSVHEKTMIPRSCLRWKQTGRIFKTVGLRWVPTGKKFTSSTTKVDSEPINGSNGDITNQYEYKQTLDVSAGTLNLSAAKFELNMEKSQQGVSNDVLAVFILINGEPWLYGGGGIPFQFKSDSLLHAHAQTTKTYYKHQDSRIKKAQDSKTKTSTNSDIQDLPSRYQVY
ncbi:hypothetical protein Tco_0291503 [Tanacetum coccineum]